MTRRLCSDSSAPAGFVLGKMKKKPVRPPIRGNSVSTPQKLFRGRGLATSRLVDKRPHITHTQGAGCQRVSWGGMIALILVQYFPTQTKTDLGGERWGLKISIPGVNHSAATFSANIHTPQPRQLVLAAKRK